MQLCPETPASAALTEPGSRYTAAYNPLGRNRSRAGVHHGLKSVYYGCNYMYVRHCALCYVDEMNRSTLVGPDVPIMTAVH